MTTAQEILREQDVFRAIQQHRAAKQAEVDILRQKLTQGINAAIAPQPRPTNRMDLAIRVARNVYNIWQGVTLGMKVVRGFKSAFGRKR